MRNRSQILLILLLTALLTAGIVGAIVYFTVTPKVLRFAVGPIGTPEQMFASKLALLLEQNHASVRVQLSKRASNAEAIARFNRNDVDLVILRSDQRAPSSARALAMLERAYVLRIQPKGSKLKGAADLRGKKVAVIGDDGANERLVRAILDQDETDGPDLALETRPSSTPLADLLAPGGFDAVFVVEGQSRITGSKAWEELARRTGGFVLGETPEAKAIARKVPGLVDETIDAGLLSSTPRIPEEEAEALAVDHVLVVRAKVSDAQVVELARAIFENKDELAAPKAFATAIEPPDVDKDATIAAHNGVTQYVENDVKTFLDRYSDLIYLTVSVGSLVASLGFAVFASYTRNSPKHAHAFAEEYLDFADRIRLAPDAASLNAAEAELRDNLKAAMRGMSEGRVSPRGMEAFRMGHDLAREAIVHRRAELRGQASAAAS